jgi:DNA (cytosine-5)-methyltransferase 1
LINYYNENDPKAAAWLRELIKDGHIANGIVDERSIKDVQPNDLTDFTQCHFFAGIGGWSYALRLAGWPDDRPVWTGSCPCQPFSDAGQKGGTKDKRHLWPDFFRLIREYRPTTVFGEQVASKDGLAWLDIVSADLESEGYAVGAIDLCAAGVEAPHIRQRLWFVADANGANARAEREQHGRELRFEPTNGGAVWLADWIECTDGKWRPVEPLAQQMANGLSVGLGCVRGLGDTEKEALINATQSTGFAAETLSAVREGNDPAEIWRAIGGRLGFPAASVLLALLCQYSGELGVVFYGAAPGSPEVCEADLRAVRERRPFTCSPPRRGLSEQSAGELTDLVSKVSQAHPSLAAFNGFPLSKGVPGRAGLLRGYGNAIVPQVAAEFVRATMDRRS